MLDRQRSDANATPLNTPMCAAGPCGSSTYLPRAVAAGRVHSLILTAGGRVWAVGAGMFGRLGLGHEGDVAVPAPVAALQQRRVVQVRVCVGSVALVVRVRALLMHTTVMCMIDALDTDVCD